MLVLCTSCPPAAAYRFIHKHPAPPFLGYASGFLISLPSDITMTSSREETHRNHAACACRVTSCTITHCGSYGTQLLSTMNENGVRLHRRGYGIRRGQEPGVRVGVRLEPRRRGGKCSSPTERGTLPTTSAFAGLIVAAVVAAVSCFPGARAMSAGADHSCAVISDGRVKVSAESVCEGVFERLLLKMCFRWTNQMDEYKVFRV